MRKVGRLLLKGFLWILTLAFVQLALVNLPSPSGFLALAAVLILLPVRRWQKVLDRFLPRKIKTLTAVVLVVLLCALLPNAQTPDLTTGPLSPEPTVIATETVPADTTSPTVESTASPTVKPTAAPTAKPTASPTAKPTASPTVKPTASPTVKPTASPTAKPTASPTAAPTPEATKDTRQNYVLNTNSDRMRFHYPSCSSVKDIKDTNRQDYYGTREELIQKGYTPCGRCKP